VGIYIPTVIFKKLPIVDNLPMGENLANLVTLKLEKLERLTKKTGELGLI
jgi:hypothetical protein